MRTIKFRGWIKEEKRMVDDTEIGICEPDDAFGTNLALILGAGDVILMQYTGLLDKNGKEIYESDIVRIAETYTSQEPHVIVWNKRGAWKVGNKTFVAGLYELEIIGNLYQNPDLLPNKE